MIVLNVLAPAAIVGHGLWQAYRELGLRQREPKKLM
jgi:hypothetical protein